jgi:hypothetical protein
MKLLQTVLRYAAVTVVAAFFLAGPLHAAKDDVPTPKEYGVYVKTATKLVRILPNIVFQEGKMLYIESNNPPHFSLKDVKYFLLYGSPDMQYLTFNNLLFINQSPLGKPRFIFGKEVEVEVKNRGDALYTVRPKGLFGRGYYALWINDSAWDFIVE